MVMSACSRAIPLCTSSVLKLFDEDSAGYLFALGSPNFGMVGLRSLLTRHVCVAELRTKCAVFWRAGRNCRVIRRCRITNDKCRVESLFLCACKRRRVGLICRNTCTELFHFAAGLYLE